MTTKTYALRTARETPAHSANAEIGNFQADGSSFWLLFGKNLFDLVGATVLLIVTVPLTLFAAVLIKLTSRGPIFYTQTRVGLNGRPFTIIKLRTMRHHCEALSGPQWSAAGDSRITPVGRFLRRTHIDEFPQLWNVIRGDMSLVGPRPERPEFTLQLEQLIPGYADRFQVRPGITGLAQIQLPADTTLDSVRRKLAYDLYHIDRIGFWLEFRILVFTALKMVGAPFAKLNIILRIPSKTLVENLSDYVESDPIASPENFRKEISLQLGK